MSERSYARVFRKTASAGVYHLPEGSEQAIARSARKADLEVMRVDLAGVRDKPAFLERLAAALAFPDWFGQNWDALDDCLTDLSWIPARGYALMLLGCDEFRVADEAGFAMALQIFADAADEWRKEGVAFWVLIDLHANGIAHLRALPTD